MRHENDQDAASTAIEISTSLATLRRPRALIL
jgi:hypothetical protein